MAVCFDEMEKTFHLTGGNISYAMQVVDGHLLHVYFGKQIKQIKVSGLVNTVEKPWSPNPKSYGDGFALDTAQFEFPTHGRLDFRYPAIMIEKSGTMANLSLKYKCYKILNGKPDLEGLPSTYVEKEDEAQTLVITLADAVCGLEVDLLYTVFQDANVIIRSTNIKNISGDAFFIKKTQSMSIDFADSNFDMLHLSGAWARERNTVKRPLVQGIQSIDSTRGISGHVHNPFVALISKYSSESSGEVYGFNLVYSGNFDATVEVGEFFTTRVSIGLGDYRFGWRLNIGESFQTPEVVMVYSDEGIGGMSRTFHDLYRERLCRGVWKDKTRPIILNNWEATYFDFDNDKLQGLAKSGRDLGIELFVLDDGWFGKRNNDLSSLGDWVVNEEKLNGSMAELVEKINKQGMLFGLWFEPEMISKDSDLYRKHPDYCLAYPDSVPIKIRNQLVLDMSRKEVCDTIFEMISDVLKNANIAYVKWDMNRYLTDVYSRHLPADRQGEVAHRYILGVYYLMEKLTKQFPKILFEGCAGGGGRYDPGILFYMPQIWASDNTDAIERVKIQYGTSLVYPVITMDCNVSDVPNHQIGRTTPLETRGNVAMCGNLGFQLNLSHITICEKETIKKQIEFYHSIKRIIAFGDLFRLLSPFEGNDASWQFVTKDKEESVLFYINMSATPNVLPRKIKLRGLNANNRYMVSGMRHVFGGDQLMYAGIHIPELKDFESVLYHIKKTNEAGDA